MPAFGYLHYCREKSGHAGEFSYFFTKPVADGIGKFCTKQRLALKKKKKVNHIVTTIGMLYQCGFAYASATGDYSHLGIFSRCLLNLPECQRFYFSVVELHINATAVTVTAVTKLHKIHFTSKSCFEHH